MGGYFGGVVGGRLLSSRLAGLHDPKRLLAVALVPAAVGFAVLRPSTGSAQALLGLALLGIGLANLFPLVIAVALAPDRAVSASGRAVGVSSFAVLLAPLTVGTLADATSLTAVFAVVPVLIALAMAGLLLVVRAG